MAKRPFHRKLIKFVSDDTPVFHRGYKVNVGKETVTGAHVHCYRDILDKIITHVEDERRRRDILFIGGFHLVFNEENHPSVDDQRKIMTSFFNGIKTYLGRKTVNPDLPLRNHKSVKIGWVREYGSVKKWHYHCYICLDGSRVGRWDIGLKKLIDDLWKKCAGKHYSPVYVNNPMNRKHNKNHWIVTPDSKGDTQLHHAIYALSYYAKFRDKRDKRTVANLATHSIPVIDTLEQARERFRKAALSE